MSFSVYRGEKRLSDLSTRLFGKLKAADAKRVAAALLAANPELEHLDVLSKGRPFIVPDIEGLGRREDADVATPRSELLDAARAGLAAYTVRLRDAMASERSEIDSARELLASDELRRFLDSNPGAAELLDAVAKATDRREAAIKDRPAFLKTLREADAELAKLTRQS
jgi:hypothetical protein